MKVSIEATADGSPTLYREDIDEHYHSVKGALTEGKHVYVDMGWRKCAESIKDEVRVFEVGFGCGLNAALTSMEALAKKIPTRCYSVELYPIPAETAAEIAGAYSGYLKAALITVNNAKWGEDVTVNPYFTLHKIQADLLKMTLPENVDVVYFDAFAPEKQPEMWSEEIFRKLYASMRQGGVLTTYCAKGAIRRMLERVGFRCERLQGPPGGKREILRASKY